MTRTELENYILSVYNAESDYPWLQYPNFRVFRHVNNKKWFAIIMDIPRNKLGLEGTEHIDIVNFKCNPILIGSFRKEPGFYPGYHMNKEHWISAALDGNASDETIRLLLDMSYEATGLVKQKR